MKHTLIPCFAALLLSLSLPASSWALTAWDLEGVEGMTYLDSGKGGPDTNYSQEKIAKLLINSTEEAGQTHLLFRAPQALFDVDLSLLAQTAVSFHVTKVRNYDDRAIFLKPLSVPYEAATATWNSSGDTNAWTVAGGDVLDFRGCPGCYNEKTQTLDFDLGFLLSDDEAREAFRANGALVQLDETERPESGVVMFQLATALNPDASLRPEVFWAELDPYEDERDFAVSYIDSRDPATVWWEQGESFVGKVVLNGMDGSECRAILTVPETLAAAVPSRVQSVVAKFDAEIRDWEGEAIFLAPLTTKTWLERHPNNNTSPVHGPSWTWADGAVDTNATSFVVDETTYDNAAWEVPGGDWMADFVIQGTVMPPLSGSTTGMAKFDLTDLWHDDAARKNLIENGAIVYLDPKAFDQVKEDKRMARVNLYRPDDIVADERGKFSWVRVTEYEQFAAGSGVTPLTAVRIDSESPDKDYFGQSSAKIVMNYRNNTETRAFCTLPEGELDEDLPALDGYTLRFNGGFKEDGDKIPVLLSPVTNSFGTTSELRTTWNSAWTNPATGEAGAWSTPGGDIDAFTVVGLYDTDSGDLTFNLADLQKNDAAADLALAYGLVMRFDPDQTVVDPESGAMPRITIGAAGEIVKKRKTVATTYIEKSEPGKNYSTSANKTLVLMNKVVDGDHNETRTLVKLSPALLDLDLNRAGTVNLLLSYFRAFPGDDETVNPVALHPAATAFRLDEATWNNATTNVAWETPGGDFLDAHVVGTDSQSRKMLTFDLAPLLADAESAAALASNGAIIRMLGDAPLVKGSNGYNVNGSLSPSVPVIVLAPGELAVRGLGIDEETGALKFSVKGLDPLQKYVLARKAALDDTETEWEVVMPCPPGGELSVIPTGAACFYRIQLAE